MSWLKDYVDVFLIGNELLGLTSICNENNNFIAVDNLVALAEKVRKIVGNDVKISYAAGYKEYHSLNGYYNLDKLWSDKNIDFVGINAFFPLTSSTQDSITKDSIKNAWFSGEGYDFIDNELVEPKNAYKNIEYWWKNKHINIDNTITSWIEESKKIWFISYGFRSIDATTNEPYKNINELPIYSTGESSFYAQRLAIEATEEELKAKAEEVAKMYSNGAETEKMVDLLLNAQRAALELDVKREKTLKMLFESLK